MCPLSPHTRSLRPLRNTPTRLIDSTATTALHRSHHHRSSRPAHQPSANAYIVALLLRRVPRPRRTACILCPRLVSAARPACVSVFSILFLARDSRAHDNTTTLYPSWDTAASLPRRHIYIRRAEALLKRNETRRDETLNPPAIHINTPTPKRSASQSRTTVY